MRPPPRLRNSNALGVNSAAPSCSADVDTLPSDQIRVFRGLFSFQQIKLRRLFSLADQIRLRGGKKKNPRNKPAPTRQVEVEVLRRRPPVSSVHKSDYSRTGRFVQMSSSDGSTRQLKAFEMTAFIPTDYIKRGFTEHQKISSPP